MCSYSPSRELLFPLLSSFRGVFDFNTPPSKVLRSSGEGRETFITREKREGEEGRSSSAGQRPKTHHQCRLYVCAKKLNWEEIEKPVLGNMPSTSWRRMWESEKEKRRWNVREERKMKTKTSEKKKQEMKERKKISHDHKVNFEICSYAAPCQWLWVSRIMLFPTHFVSCLMAGFRKTFSRDVGDRAGQSLSSVLLFWPRLCARSRTSISLFHIVLGRTLLCIEKHDFLCWLSRRWHFSRCPNAPWRVAYYVNALENLTRMLQHENWILKIQNASMFSEGVAQCWSKKRKRRGKIQ